MSAPSSSSGIQTLLEAENKAQETVQEARAYRSQRIKASKTEAAKEIEEYKQKKDAEFKKSASKFESNEDNAEKAAASAAKSEIDSLKAKAHKERSSVVKYLVEQTTQV